MRTYMRKPAMTSRNMSGSASPGRMRVANRRVPDAMAFMQHVAGNQAARRLVRASAENDRIVSMPRTISHSGDNLAAIPVHARSPVRVQTKSAGGAGSDVYEQEADRVAEQVMRAPVPGGACACGATCPTCRSGRAPQAYGGLSRGTEQTATAPAIRDGLRSGGQPLDGGTRTFMEPRFGRDFSGVRIHADDRAASLATSLQARAFTLGRDIVFNRGAFSPDTRAGRQLLAHELTHVVQQTGTGESGAQVARSDDPVSVRESTPAPAIARVSASDCASDCAKEDGTETASGKFSITVYADKEGPFLLLPLTQKVGHSWLRLQDDKGRYWTFGFWPKEGYDPSNIHADVDGCVHHPDKIHTPTATQTFELTAAQFSAAFSAAVATCTTPPKYNLFGLQCTEFVKRILTAAGKGSFGGFGLIWESPNALDTWIRTHSLILGTSVTAATSAPGKAGAGSFGLDLSYRYQFYSLLGQKLRLYGLGRAEISGPVKSLTAGTGVELNPQKVWLPALFLEGGGILGDLDPRSGQSRFGSGVTGAAGLRFNIDELGVVGIEYNVVKDLVNKDPVLHRLMFTVGFRLF